MTHVLVDDWLYMDVDGAPGRYGREEVQRGIKSKIKSVSGAFIDCEVKVIQLAGADNIKKKFLIDEAFSNAYVTQEECIAGNVIQVIAAQKTKIEEIYQYFNPTKVSVLVPYPVAIRAFLKSRSLLPQNKIVVFIDDLKTQAIVTILEGMHFTAPRRMNPRPIGDMILEIKRSQQNYLAHRIGYPRETELDFILISNNQEWLSAFIEHGLIGVQATLGIDDTFPVLEGLKVAKFGVHFASPLELAVQKKRLMIQKRFMAMLVSALMGAVGLGLYLLALVHKNDAVVRVEQLKIEQDKVLNELAQVYQHKFKQILSQSSRLPYGRLYFDFIHNLPEGYAVKEFTVRYVEADHWECRALIYPINDGVALRDFKKQGVFAKAQVSKVSVGKVLGQKIVLNIKQTKGLL